MGLGSDVARLTPGIIARARCAYDTWIEIIVMVPEDAIRDFLSKVRAAQALGILPNAQLIGNEIFAEPVLKSTINLV